MEEILRSERNYLIIKPSEKSIVPLCDCGSDRILRTEFGDADCVSRVLERECYDLRIIISPCRSAAVFNSVLSVCVCIIFLELDFGIVL